MQRFTSAILQMKAKKLVIIICILLSLFTGVVMILYLNAGSIIKQAFNQFGPGITGVETHVSAVYLNPWSGEGTIKSFFLGNPPGFKTPSAIQVKSIHIKVDPKSLFQTLVVISEVKVDSPVVTLEGSPGDNNLNRLKSHLTGSSQGHSSASPTKITVRHLKIEDIRLQLQISGLQSQPSNLSLPNIELRNLGGHSGASAGEVSAQVISHILQSCLSVVLKLPGLLKSGVESTVKGIKSLFH